MSVHDDILPSASCPTVSISEIALGGHRACHAKLGAECLQSFGNPGTAVAASQHGSIDAESAPASATMYVDDCTLAVSAHRGSYSMPPQPSLTMPIIASAKPSLSPGKPAFKIRLPPTPDFTGQLRIGTYILPETPDATVLVYQCGLPLTYGRIDGAFDRTLPLLSLPILTPPEERLEPSWEVAPKTNHGAISVELTPPWDVLDMAMERAEVAPGKSLAGPQGQKCMIGAVDGPRDLLTASIKLAVENLILGSDQPKTIRTVHQLAPCPLSNDDVRSPVSILPSVLSHLLPDGASSPNWVLVTHAIPERYPVKGLTGSPGNTPLQFSGQNEAQDYFSCQNVVNNAIVLAERKAAFSSGFPAPGPVSPGLASTPYSIDLSLYQRFLPPASVQDVQDIFAAGSPSPLVDRLTELVPSGRLIFVYPTRIGAQTFQREYLDRALAPITRSIVFGKGLSADACAAVASSGAAEAIPSFDEMCSSLRGVLHGLGENGTSMRRSRWSILSAGTQCVTLPRKVWEQWWTVQEDGRVRQVMDYYFRQVSRRSFYRDERFTANELAREIMQELIRRGSAPDADAATVAPIEVAVFVIERDA